MTTLINCSIDKGIATIEMDDGKVNVLSHSMWDQLEAAFDKAEHAETMVVLKGRAGIFSAGFDLKEMSKGLQQAVDLTARGSRMARRILAFPTPVIAISTGHCMAMGAFLMLACDYRVGLLGKYKVGLNETAIGMTMHHFGIELARYRLPKNYFGRCVINAEMYTPENAIAVGFYDCVAESEQLDATINVVTDNLAKLDMNAFKQTKNKSRKDILALLARCIEADLVVPTL